jgi:hypothetical protein
MSIILPEIFSPGEAQKEVISLDTASFFVTKAGGKRVAKVCSFLRDFAIVQDTENLSRSLLPSSPKIS